MTAWMVGIDTGGTFTDLVAFEVESRELRVAKVSSSPEDASTAVMTALAELFATGVRPDQVSILVHGTTAATNAILEGKGVRTGLLITKGFRAVYEARGTARPDPAELLDTSYQKPPLLVPQSLTEEIDERLDYRGEVMTALDDDGVRQAVRRLKAKGVDAVAVCYLFSFQNSAHEERTAAIIAEEAPDWRVSLSARVLPVIREYPRLSTTVVDAYVGPIMASYLANLSERFDECGVKTPQIFLMQSNGGFMRINVAARFPNQTLLSGPAAGVVSGQEIARLAGRDHVVTFDMGGTSTDISMITEGRIEETSEGQIAGQDIGTPMLSISTLGAGGGTIAWIGRDGLLKVGPHSAGARPGPACYGRGGEAPTVTDANLLLGALGTDNILGGRMTMDAERARQAVTQHVAGPLGLDTIAAAAGIIKIVNTNMAIDLRLGFQSRGQDPRRFVLAAFGGAGPLHAAMLARELQIPTVLVPPYPGITSAMGLLQTLVKHVYVQSSVGLLSTFSVARMNALFDDLRERALADAAEEGFAPDAVAIRRQIDLRYRHQGYELAVTCPDGVLDEGGKAVLKQDFDSDHLRIYGASAPEEDAEVVTFRVAAEISVPKLETPELEAGDGDASRAFKGERQLYDVDRAVFEAAHIYDRAKLLAGDRLSGPAIVEQFDSTTVVRAGQAVEVDHRGNLIIDTGAAT